MALHVIEPDQGGEVNLVTAENMETVSLSIDNGFDSWSTVFVTISELIKLREVINAAINQQHAYQNSQGE